MSTNEKYLFLKRVLENPELDSCDRPVLKSVITKISISTNELNLESINDLWADQIDLEARMLYLIGKYSHLEDKASEIVDTIEGSYLLQLPDKMPDTNRRINKEDRMAMLRNEEEVRFERYKIIDIRALVRDLSNLHRLVIGRNQKLENISVNYRRELKADENS